MSWMMKAAVAYLYASRAAEKHVLGRHLDAVVEAIEEKAVASDPSGAEIPHYLYESCDATLRKVEDFRIMTVYREHRPIRHEIIYIHGGGYALPLAGRHWSLAGKIMLALRGRLTLPLYGLAPRYGWQDAFRLLDVAFEQVLRQHAENEAGLPEAARGRSKIIVAGDAAGGGLGMAYVLNRRDRGLRMPDAVVLVSPWLDLSVSHPDTDRIRDPLLRKEDLLAAGKQWAQGLDPADPRISPAHADLSGLPQILLYPGGRDLLAPATEAFADRARLAGTEVRLRCFPDAFHMYPVLGRAPETVETLRDLTRTLG